jgi:hypothetical protein
VLVPVRCFQECHPVVGGQVARVEPKVGKGRQDDGNGGQPGPGVDRLWPAGGVDPGVGRVAGGQRLRVVAVEAVDHPVDEGGGIQALPSLR